MAPPQLPHPYGQVSPPGNFRPLLSKAEVAYRLGGSERSVDRLASKGLITRHHLGRTVRFDAEEVEAYIRAAQDTMVDFT